MVAKPCTKGEWVCARPAEGSNERFTMVYETFFSGLGVRLPFTDFERNVLRTLNIAPSQLYPNDWGFMRAFAILCRGICSEPLVGCFFSFFQAKVMKSKG